MKDDPVRSYFKVHPFSIIRKVYDFSRPQGYGFLHYKEGSLSSEEAASHIFDAGMFGLEIHVDYAGGRSCKFHAKIDKDKGVGFFTDYWHDHSDVQLENLVKWATENSVSDEEWARYWDEILVAIRKDKT